MSLDAVLRGLSSLRHSFCSRIPAGCQEPSPWPKQASEILQGSSGLRQGQVVQDRTGKDILDGFIWQGHTPGVAMQENHAFSAVSEPPLSCLEHALGQVQGKDAAEAQIQG